MRQWVIGKYYLKKRNINTRLFEMEKSVVWGRWSNESESSRWLKKGGGQTMESESQSVGQPGGESGS